MRERFIQDAVIQNELQRPGLQQLGRGDAQGAKGRHNQAPFDLAQVRPKNLAEPFSFWMAHFYRSFNVRALDSPGSADSTSDLQREDDIG